MSQITCSKCGDRWNPYVWSACPCGTKSNGKPLGQRQAGDRYAKCLDCGSMWNPLVWTRCSCGSQRYN